MFFKTCLTLVLFFTCIYAQGGHLTEKYPHHKVLKAGNFKLYWKMNSTTVVFEIHANTSGWAGIGFSKDGLMFPGDVVIGYVSADGKGHLTDYHTVGHRPPVKDSHQDYQLLASNENHSGTMLKFSRALDTSDNNDWTITSGGMHVIWSYGDLDPATGDPQYHATNRGSAVLRLVDAGVAVGK